MNWMHSCKRVAELLSQRMDEPLGRIDELKLRLHLSLCGNCSNVEKQLNGVRAAAGDLFSGEAAGLDGEPDPGTPPGKME